MPKHTDDKIERLCVFCEYGTSVPPDAEGNVFVLCKRKGLVRDTFVCRKFSYDPLKREPATTRGIPQMEVIDLDE